MKRLFKKGLTILIMYSLYASLFIILPFMKHRIEISSFLFTFLALVPLFIIIVFFYILAFIFLTIYLFE